ncbi:MAG: DUF167 domain-containing protein [Desulfobacterales bacterium]|nr:DUF167 domain-containing protein [Desulfobacterales bacterium]
MFAITEKPEGLVFKIFVQPKASKNMIAGLYGDALKIKLTAPPVEGAANRMCLKYLAKCLKIPPASLEILSGHSSRTKRILLRYENDNGSKTEKKRIMEKVMGLLPGS